VSAPEAKLAGGDFTASLVEVSSDALLALSAAGKVLYWNRGAEALFGYTRDEALGRSIEDLVVPSDEREAVHRSLKEVFVQGVLSFDAVRQRKDGSRIEVRVSERAMSAKHQQAEFIAVSATALAEPARLRDIEESTQLKREYLLNMSHELRTPLNTIIGFADLMFRGKVGPVADDHREYLGDILGSSRQLLRLIDDVLDLARLESGRMTFRPEPIDLAQVVGEVRDVLRGPASARRIRVTTELDPTLTTVSLDPARFKQVVYGYLSNALKLTPEEGEVAIRVAPEAPDRFRIEVGHSGEGAQNHARFEIGLGLSRQIVEAQGGRVEQRDDLGKGSVLSVVLPLRAPSRTRTE
jgi:PAS domain S-box-containing protein